MRSYSNRKPIPLSRSQQHEKKKQTVLSSFQPDLNQNIQTYLTLERQKLRNLDKAAAKRIIGTAEKNLMNFMRSKAKINCFKQKDSHRQSYTALPHQNSFSQNIFDAKKLEMEIAHEQRPFRKTAQQNNPLIAQSVRAVREESRCSLKGRWDSMIQEKNEAAIYCPYSSKKKTNKMIYY